jgi:hypothetical protein
LGKVHVLRVLRNALLSEPQIQNEQAAERVDYIPNVCLLGVSNPVMFDGIIHIEPVGIRASSWLPRIKEPKSKALSKTKDFFL